MNQNDQPPSNSMAQSFVSLTKGAWEATSGSRAAFFTFVFLFIAAYTIDLAVPWAIGYTLGVFVQQGFSAQAYNDAGIGILVYIGLRLAHTICHHLGRYVQQIVSFDARLKVIENVFSSLISFPLSWHVNNHSGENLSRLHRSAGAIDNTIGTYVWQIIEGVVKLVFASIAIFALDFWVAINVMAMGLISVLMMVLFNRRLTFFIRKNNAFHDRLNRICVDYLFNIVTVKSLKLERCAREYLVSNKPEGQKLLAKIAGLQELKWGSVGIGYSIVIGTSLWIYFSGRQNISGAFDVAQVYVLLDYLNRIFQAIGSFTGYYSGLIEASTAYEDATKIFRESTESTLSPISSLPKEPLEAFSLKRLEFRYVAREGQGGIKAEDLSISPGDKIALVGPSGGGKSTLLKILGGMILPDSCEITNANGDHLPLSRVTDQCLILPQEPEIFSETVRYNLTMGERFKPEELHFYLSLCRADEVVQKLPNGWDANLSEKGLNLSVGEKQRIAMARGLLRTGDRKILLLDEPTSSLDPMTEKQIFYGILHHFADRTIITACHRLALVPLFDKIVYIRRGKIEEVGSFSQLLEKRGAFFQAWDDYEKKVVEVEKEATPSTPAQ